MNSSRILDSDLTHEHDRNVQCGKPHVQDNPGFPVARIAGGLQTPPGAQPWAVSIRLHGQSSNKSYHWCGGVLLSEFHVLTVAHCMEDYPKDVYRIRLGDWDNQVNKQNLHKNGATSLKI